MISTTELIGDVHFIGLFTIRERGRLVVSGVKSAIAGVKQNGNGAIYAPRKLENYF